MSTDLGIKHYRFHKWPPHKLSRYKNPSSSVSIVHPKDLVPARLMVSILSHKEFCGSIIELFFRISSAKYSSFFADALYPLANSLLTDSISFHALSYARQQPGPPPL